MKNYSLIGSVNSDDTIMNSKIMDPDINKLTLATSDAILITHYAKEEYFNEK